MAITQGHIRHYRAATLFYWDISAISIPATASPERWNDSASEYSPDFPFWHGVIKPRNLPAAKCHTPSCKLHYSFSVGMDQNGGSLTWELSLKEAFKVYLQDRNH